MVPCLRVVAAAYAGENMSGMIDVRKTIALWLIAIGGVLAAIPLCAALEASIHRAKSVALSVYATRPDTPSDLDDEWLWIGVVMTVLFGYLAGRPIWLRATRHESPSKRFWVVSGFSALFSGLAWGGLLKAADYLLADILAGSYFAHLWLGIGTAPESSRFALDVIVYTDVGLILLGASGVLAFMVNPVVFNYLLDDHEARRLLRSYRFDEWARSACRGGWLPSEDSVAGKRYLSDYGALALEPAWRHLPRPASLDLLAQVDLNSSESDAHRFAGFRVTTEVLAHLATISSPTEASKVAAAARHCLWDLSCSSLKPESVGKIMGLISRASERLLPHSGSRAGREAARELIRAANQFAREMVRGDRNHDASLLAPSEAIRRLAATVDVGWHA